MDENERQLLLLQDKMEKMNEEDLYKFVTENYPEAGWCGKKKLVVRKIMTFERARIYGDKDPLATE
ncbi:hypothetical protein MsAg5_14710 [Methanosarcinaceae archaeon Ag5]|uniref:Uncharacterized protein n=1 Tax=Methanolapillus africanus TaxID=3028297 RepID=A0AAE4MJD3_9EURY|nr:hypothetical protein [Methanosarcinaceae archaeon Ag5]